MDMDAAGKPQERRSQDTRERILEAAAEVFRTQGYVRATTRYIAEKSGFTEMTLFRHFGSKKNLFEAVLNQYAVPDNFEQQIALKLQGTYREDLLLFSSHVMKIMMDRRDVLQMMLCEAGHFPDLRQVLGKVPRRLRDAAAAYFRRRMENGDLVRQNPDLLAQSFLGFFFSYAIGTGFLAGAMQLNMSADDIVEEFVDFFIRGTAAG